MKHPLDSTARRTASILEQRAEARGILLCSAPSSLSDQHIAVVSLRRVQAAAPWILVRIFLRQMQFAQLPPKKPGRARQPTKGRPREHSVTAVGAWVNLPNAGLLQKGRVAETRTRRNLFDFVLPSHQDGMLSQKPVQRISSMNFAELTSFLRRLAEKEMIAFLGESVNVSDCLGKVVLRAGLEERRLVEVRSGMHLLEHSFQGPEE
ncbi:uncharacterized protein IWZ02DRAFT_509322 [Phyllosticta citriasiana]|uniref:uncharacterized protein n=1 Tax=Phyllosticta citriasiana TaxID=595635 RepID=UPI0030FDCAB5